MNAAFPYLRSEHRSEPVPPEPHRLVADIDAALGQQVFDLPQRQWISQKTMKLPCPAQANLL